MTPTERLIVALDRDTVSDNLQLVDQLMPLDVRFYKVGMSLFYQAGLPLVQQLKARGCRVFVDLKLHDIPNTVARTVKVLAQGGVDFLNVHALGGLTMMQTAKAALAGYPQTTLLGVTILTSHDQAVLTDELRIAYPVAQQVAHLAQLAQQAGLNGVVCSAQEASLIAQDCGPDFLRVTPGVRLADQTLADQRRVLTPHQALRQGATHLVVGRPIYAATDPIASTRRILDEMQSALDEAM